MPTALQDLLAILDLEQLEHNLFRGRSPDTSWQRVFGGQRSTQKSEPSRASNVYSAGMLVVGAPSIEVRMTGLPSTVSDARYFLFAILRIVRTRDGSPTHVPM